jgi:phosphohistidine phosphatase SixA
VAGGGNVSDDSGVRVTAPCKRGQTGPPMATPAAPAGRAAAAGAARRGRRDVIEGRRRWLQGGAAWLLTAAIPRGTVAATPDAALAELAAGGRVLLLRHAATTPGIGDPAGFRLGDCATQRNLSDAGRDAARALGVRLAAAGVRLGPVLSSGWCRCLDTATLAFGRAERWPPLDSFFEDRRAEPKRTAEVRARIAAWRGPGTLVLVTHMVNIAAITGTGVAMGEALVLAPAPGSASAPPGATGFDLVGRL